MPAIDLTGLDGEQRRRLMLAAGLMAAAFVVVLLAGALAGSAALKADALDFAAAGLGIGLSFLRPVQNRRARVIAGLASSALLVLLGAMVAASTFYAFFVRQTPEPTLMAAGAVVALAANGAGLYLLRAERLQGPLNGLWLQMRNDLVGSAAVLVAAGVVALVDNSVPDLTVAGVIVVLSLMEAVSALRKALAEWEALRTEGGLNRAARSETPKPEGP